MSEFSSQPSGLLKVLPKKELKIGGVEVARIPSGGR